IPVQRCGERSRLLVACGATPVAVGALVVLGTAASEFASSSNLVLESIAALPNSLWTPSECRCVFRAQCWRMLEDSQAEACAKPVLPGGIYDRSADACAVLRSEERR